jgi:cytidylate kinase
LGVKCVDREIMEEASKLANISEPKFTELCEKKPGFFERLSLISKAESYVQHIYNAMNNFAKGKGVVVLGRGGHLLIPDGPEVLHVRILAPFSMRVEKIMEEENLDSHAASEKVLENDQGRAMFHRYLFDEDWDNALLYDMVINTGSVSIGAAVAIILNALEEHRQDHPDLSRLPSLGEEEHFVPPFTFPYYGGWGHF